MCNIAIDFGKHGKRYVPDQRISQYRQEMNRAGYPDFMEKFHMRSVLSNGVLGHLYRQVKDREQEALVLFIQQDYMKSIQLEYELDPV